MVFFVVSSMICSYTFSTDHSMNDYTRLNFHHMYITSRLPVEHSKLYIIVFASFTQGCYATS